MGGEEFAYWAWVGNWACHVGGLGGPCTGLIASYQISHLAPLPHQAPYNAADKMEANFFY